LDTGVPILPVVVGEKIIQHSALRHSAFYHLSKSYDIKHNDILHSKIQHNNFFYNDIQYIDYLLKSVICISFVSSYGILRSYHKLCSAECHSVKCHGTHDPATA
jgi:hypothetical protein